MDGAVMQKVPADVASDDNDSEKLKKSSVEQTFESVDSSTFTDESKYSFLQRRARCMARNPWIHLNVTLVLSATLSAIGIVVGNFTVSVDNAGWNARGTLIANRQIQMALVLQNQFKLAQDDSDSVWEDLLSNVQQGSTSLEDGGESGSGRKLKINKRFGGTSLGRTTSSTNPRLQEEVSHLMTHVSTRQLQQRQQLGTLQECDVGWYTDGRMIIEEHLWPIWKTRKPSISILEANVIRDICHAEEKTQQILETQGLCFGCDGGKCLPPYSIVFFARQQVDYNFTLSCDELATAWEGVTEAIQAELLECVRDMNNVTFKLGDTLPYSCPSGFAPFLIDSTFHDSNPVIRYSSSIFATNTGVTQNLFEISGDFDRASSSSFVQGAYDTQYEALVDLQIDDSLTNDMILALGSAAITALAILVHTRSPWLTFIGLLQIILSFPLSYFFYKFVCGLVFFPFLNFIGVFVIFALGADDIFVAVDKWKNARLANKNGSIEDIAATALPDAGVAMFLTSITTAAAFFGTAICPVAPLSCFSIFCGLLVCFDYIMCVLLVFPALCIYDNYNQSGRNWCISCHACHKYEEHGPELDNEEPKPSLITRILTATYNGIHLVRWPLLVVCLASLGICSYFAMKLDLPNSSDVRLLNAKSSQFETNFQWRLNLLFDVLTKEGGSQVYVAWGLSPADTGNYFDPSTWSQLKLDNSFDPSAEDAQLYLAAFCDDLFSNDFATKTEMEYECPMNKFDKWLQEQANSTMVSDTYVNSCNGLTGLPVPREEFNACMSAWALLTDETSVLSRNGVVQIMYLRFQSHVRYDSPYDKLDNEWKMIERWMSSEREMAPPGTNEMFHSSVHFWWYDTNGQMLYTAYGGAVIALAIAALVALISTRSIMLTLFALVTILYILTATTAMLVASGWTLGFLESICFAILIGVSCDFVLHFGHSYASLQGEVNRHDRSKHALVVMGPSILAGAFTTICAALIMIFTVISFFQRFATILFYTIIQSILGSFIFFITLTDTIGPSNPTHMCDLCLLTVKNFFCKNKEESESRAKNIDEADRNEHEPVAIDRSEYTD